MMILRQAGALFVAVVLFVAVPATASVAVPDDFFADRLEPADSVEGNYLAALAAGAAKDTRAAALYFGEALKRDPRNNELLERAFITFLANGSMDEAFRAGERLLTRDPNNGLAHLALGVRDIRARKYISARTHLTKGGKGRAADITATLLTAWSWVGSRNSVKALETVDRLKGENSYNTFREYHAALVADVSGRKDEAATRMKAAYDAERTTLRMVDAYARFTYTRGSDKEAALAAYEAFDRLSPRHPLVRDAIDAIKADRPLPPVVNNARQGAAEVLYGLGAAGNSQGDELAAMIYLQLSLYLDEQNVLAFITLADILERLKQPARAIEVYDRIPRTSPVRPSADVQIGLGLETIGRAEEAVKHLKELIAQKPDDVEGIIALGNVERSRKNFADAAAIYSKAIERIGTPDRGYWTLYYARGVSYERSRQWPKAEADFKKALELVPDAQPQGRAVVLNYLGYSWVDQGINLDEGFQMLKRAVELNPRDGQIVDSLGWAYFRLGRYEDAVRELEKAIELRPSDSTINDHLGDAYWKVGRKLEARFQWNHARDLGPEPDDRPKILKKIEAGLVEEAPAAAEAEKAKKNGG